MTRETQAQAKEHLRLAVERCRQENLPIWEALSAVQEAFLDWARRENLDVKLTVTAK